MSSEFKVLVAVVLVAIVASLGKALFHMSSSPEQSELICPNPRL
jgi:hypothetical protein